MIITPKNWSEFQHYKDRNPPWIKLHRGLLDDFDWWMLPVASRALAPCLWLLASCSDDGLIDAKHEKLAFRFRMAEEDIATALKPLMDKGFFIVASNVLADCKQDAMPETETETEAETDLPPQSKKVKPQKKQKIEPHEFPDGLSITELQSQYCQKHSLDALHEFESFRLNAISKGLEYSNWSAAFSTWTRNAVKFRRPAHGQQARLSNGLVY